jgi:N6-L-threonylcarbamoyladenine synthase
MEKLALENNLKVPARKPKLSDFKINLSGIENLAKKMYDESANKELVSAYVLNHIADSLIALCEKYESTFGKSSFVFAGGVMSNKLMRSEISSRFEAYFAEPEFSADNAAGVALLARLKASEED